MARRNTRKSKPFFLDFLGFLWIYLAAKRDGHTSRPALGLLPRSALGRAEQGVDDPHVERSRLRCRRTRASPAQAREKASPCSVYWSQARIVSTAGPPPTGRAGSSTNSVVAPPDRRVERDPHLDRVRRAARSVTRWYGDHLRRAVKVRCRPPGTRQRAHHAVGARSPGRVDRRRSPAPARRRRCSAP